MPGLIEDAFGVGCDLYADVLQCPRNADKAALRKAYYRTALKYHPDKNPGNVIANQQFQAVSLAYQMLLDRDIRAIYDETGEIPSESSINDDDNNDDDDDGPGSRNTKRSKKGVAEWKAYFDTIFGKVTANHIDAFAAKYKCSDEERRDVLKQFIARKGHLVQMLDFVMLSEPRDAARWVEDYLIPAMTPTTSGAAALSNSKKRHNSKNDNKTDAAQYAQYRGTMEKTLKQIQKRIDKERAAEAAAEEMSASNVNNEADANAHDDDDDDEEEHDNDETDQQTESESDDDDAKEKEEIDDDDPPLSSRKRRMAKNMKKTKLATPSKKKAKLNNKLHETPSSKVKTSSKAKSQSNKSKVNSSSSGKKSNNGDMSTLIAQIQNKHRGGGGGGAVAWSNLGARYGVQINDEDPMNDEEFVRIQSKIFKTNNEQENKKQKQGTIGTNRSKKQK